MTVQITDNSISSENSISLLDFDIQSSGFSDIFTDSNCVPTTTSKNTFNITDCTTVNCTTVNCTTVDCTTVNCTTVDCTTIQCNTNCSYDADCDSYDTDCNNDA